MTTAHHHQNRRRWPALAFALTTATALAQTAPAPKPAEGDDPIRLEAFTVTGSNIKRLDVEKVLPVSVITTAEMD
ncbi:MAG: hypothetical protein ABIQ12_04385, partial [Opitutaceae bacterium]